MGAISIVLLWGTVPAQAQLNVIRRARQLKTEQEDRRTNLESQAEELTGGDSSSSTDSSSSAGTSRTSNRSQPVSSQPTEAATDTRSTRPAVPVTGSQPQSTVPTSSAGQAIADPIDPQAQFETSVARWHVTHNVCTRSWSSEEFSRLFPRIDRDLAAETCDR